MASSFLMLILRQDTVLNISSGVRGGLFCENVLKKKQNATQAMSRVKNRR